MRIKKVQERWFPAKGDTDGAEVLVRHLKPGEVQDIAEAALPQKISYAPDAKGNMVPDFSISPQRSKERSLTFNLCVIDWKNFFDEAGKPLKFNEKNLLRAMREIEGFSEWINECRDVLAKEIAEENKAQEKNLSSSAAG